MKIVYLDAKSIGNTSQEPIAKLGELVTYPSSSRREALIRVKDAEVLIVNKVIVDRELLDAAPVLKLVCVSATGVNNIDLQACKEKNVIVRNVAGYSTNSVVQLTFAIMLSLICEIHVYDEYVKTGMYGKSGLFTDVSHPFSELEGKTLGVIGMGNIGRKVSSIAEAFGMKIIYYSTSGTSHCADYESVTLSRLMSESDVVSIHAPLNEKTAGLIGEEQISFMKQGAVLLNLGRGGIVDEAALVEAINSEKIFGAGLDVYEQEPLPEDSPLLKCKFSERLILTPHVGWASSESLDRLVLKVAENISLGW